MNKFYINDWVKHLETHKLYMITSEAVEAVKESPYTYTYNSTGGLLGHEDIEIWKPVRGEMCVFWDDNSYKVIDEYVWSKKNNGLNSKRFVANVSSKSYQNIAPIKYTYYMASMMGIFCD